MKLNDYEREHLDRLRPILPECTVLLKRSGDFPLAGPGQLALFGGGARRTVKGGTGSGEVNSRFFVTVEEGLERAGFTITTGPWLDAYDDVMARAREDFVREVMARAERNGTSPLFEGMGAVMPEPEYELPLEGAGDTAVYVLSRIAGEGNDRSLGAGDFGLTRTEIRDILALNRKYRRFMLVLNVGGPVDLSPVMEVRDILLLSQLGVETGSALADLLLGRTYPSGKLTATWAAEKDLPRLGDFGRQDETRYREGVYVGYRYYDSAGVEPLFPFGFGLGYTDFTVVPAGAEARDGQITVRARVTNTGCFPGRETAQLYVSVPAGRLDQPFQTLAAFRKTPELAPGETGEVELSFDIREIASFDEENARWLLERGDYVLRLGTCSRSGRPAAVVRLDRDVTVLRVRNCLGEPDFTDWRPERPRQEALPADLPVLALSGDGLEEAVCVYDAPVSPDPLAETLTDEELAYLGVGAFDPEERELSVIGNAGELVAGAAGETVGILGDRGVPALVMADGPAGLRLAREYVTYRDRTRTVGQTIPETMAAFLPAEDRRRAEEEDRRLRDSGPVLNQFATAIPIGTALAQTWDPALAEVCGDIVGEEMERFGVHLWLAPALNIQRDVRCGRNFEYYAEDPLVSGLFAAAVTRGVQAHPGRAVTVKHFAANNQETNRFSNNSQVSRRAMREIYLRGFGVCIRTAHPLALMTSYNLLNGVHTSERRDLIQDIARAEFGFDGIVMTDWVIRQMEQSSPAYPSPSAAKVAAAGGDLFMPGSAMDVGQILDGIADGTVTRAQLRENASRVIRLARRLSARG